MIDKRKRKMIIKIAGNSLFQTLFSRSNKVYFAEAESLRMTKEAESLCRQNHIELWAHFWRRLFAGCGSATRWCELVEAIPHAIQIRHAPRRTLPGRREKDASKVLLLMKGSECNPVKQLESWPDASGTCGPRLPVRGLFANVPV